MARIRIVTSNVQYQKIKDVGFRTLGYVNLKNQSIKTQKVQCGNLTPTTCGYFAKLRSSAARFIPVGVFRRCGRLLTGFTLIEVIISISILTMGLVLILQGFVHSLNIIQITKNNTQASFLVDEITERFLLDSRIVEGSFSDKVSGEMEIDNAKYSWDISIEQNEEQEKINEIFSTVSWVSGKRRGQVSVATYLGLFQDEEEGRE